MENILNIANTVWLYIVVMCFVISKIHDVFEKKEKNVPGKYQGIFDIADMIVAQYDTKDMRLEEKKENATIDLMKQAEADGKPITKTVAKGAIEVAVRNRRTDAATTDDVKSIGFVNDED